MNKSPINKIGNTTTNATDTRKKPTKPRRRFGLTCSEKRQRAKWAKINEKRRANTGLSKTARKAKNKAAEARIVTHKTEVAAARRAHRNAKLGIVEEAVVVEEATEELKPLIAGLFTLLDISSTAPNKVLNAALGTFAYEQLVEICTKAMPGPMGRTYAGRFNKPDFVATTVFTETSKTTRKAMLLTKLSDSFIGAQQTALQTKIIEIERTVKPVVKKVVKKVVKAPGPVKLVKRESVEKTKMVAPMIGVVEPAEIDSLESSVVKLGMNNNNDNDITKNNNEEWHNGCGGDGAWSDDEAPDTWDSGSESEPEEEVVKKRGLRAPTSKQLARVNAQRDGGAHVAGLGMKQLEALQRMAEKRPGIEECKVDLVGKSSWVVAKPAAVEVEVEKPKPKPKPKQRTLIKRVKRVKKKNRKFLTSLQSAEKAEEKMETICIEEKEEEKADIDMDDLESSDDEDALMAFAKIAKPVVKKKPVAKKKPAAKKMVEVSEATSLEMEAIAKIQQAENLAISQAVAFKPQPKVEKKADFPELGSFPKLNAAIATGRVTTQRGEPGKGKKAMRRRAHGVDVTHLFFSGRQEAKQEAVREAKQAQEAVKEVKVAENARRTDILKMMEARQSEDARVKALANKPLHFTRRCRGAFNMATGQWKKKVDCTHPRCLFAHSQKQLTEALRGCICTFDGGKGKCRKPATCTFLHTVRATEDSCGKSSYLCKCPRRVETDEEYQSRTGFALGEFRDRRSKGNLAKAPTRVSGARAFGARRTMPSQTRRPVNRQTGFRSKQHSGPTRDTVKVTGTMSFAAITARAKEKKATPVLKDSEGFTIDPRKYKSGVKKVVASITKVQAIFRGNKDRIGFSDRLVAFRQERAEIAREQAMRKAAEEHEKRARVNQSSGFNWKPTRAVVKVVKPVVKASVHTITTLLSEFRLNADVAGKLVQIGAEDVADLKDMEVEDVADLGLKKLEQKRFLKLLDFIKA